MMKLLYRTLILAALLSLGAHPGFAAAPKAAAAATAMDSKQLEKSLQGLEWPQFRAVIEAVPELRREVDKYGSLGWDYVRQRYKTYGWKKNIDKLDAAERQRLTQLVLDARKKK